VLLWLLLVVVGCYVGWVDSVDFLREEFGSEAWVGSD